VNEAALSAWRQTHPEVTSYDGQHLAEMGTVFDKLERGRCEALIYRGWWLIGAALSAYASSRLPDPSKLRPPVIPRG
jgi:NTE family protein